MPSVKFDVDVSSFKNGISSAKSEVKTLDQQMKMIDATFKATGNSEQALAQKTQTLNSRMTAQKTIADQAKQALDAMTQKGIDPASESYQKMARELLAAQTGMMETQAALNDLSNGAVQAAGSADKLEKGLNGISKKISLDQVIGGIGRITDGLEKAAQKAVNLGESIWDNIMSSARWADDTATMALMYGIDLDTFQRMQKLVTNGMDTSVESMLSAQKKLKKGVGDETDKVSEAFKTLNIRMKEYQKTATGQQLMPRDSVDLFWEAGQALMNLNDEFKQESMAQTLFGKSWQDLRPLFAEYKNAQEYADAMQEVKGVIDDDKMNAGATLNDKVAELEGNLKSLKDNVLLTIAGPLGTATEALNKLLESILEYLETPEGQEMLDSLGESIGSLFEGLKNISAEEAVGTFKDALESIVSGFEWIKNNGDSLLKVLEGIGIFWAGLKVSSGVLTLLKVIDGLKGLAGLGGAEKIAQGLAVGASKGVTSAAALINNPLLQANVPVIGDWFIHNTGFGQELMGTKEKGSTWEEIKGWFSKENIDKFIDNWNPNSENANVIAKFFGEMGKAWNGIGDYWNNREKDWQLMGKWTYGDEVTAEDAKNIINGGEPIAVEIKPEIPENWDFGEHYTSEEIYAMLFGDQKPKTEIVPEVPEDTASKISKEIGTVYVNVAPITSTRGGGGGGNGGNGRPWLNQTHANGLWSVPRDNYLAILHKDEQIVPARQVAQNNRTFNSNIYYENVNINNGMDADGMAARVAAEQRRMANSFGGS